MTTIMLSVFNILRNRVPAQGRRQLFGAINLGPRGAVDRNPWGRGRGRGRGRGGMVAARVNDDSKSTCRILAVTYNNI